ncbi:unnamed protein product [Discula destructiva]
MDSQIEGFIRNILHADADADVLVLQEVTDSAMSELLHDNQMREKYPFCSHCLADVSVPNAHQGRTMVFSKYAFGWELAPLSWVQNVEEDNSGCNQDALNVVEDRNRQHNRVILVKFENNEEVVTKSSSGPTELPTPVTLIACHFTPRRPDDDRSDHQAIMARTRILETIEKCVFPGTPIIIVGNLDNAPPAYALEYHGHQERSRKLARFVSSIGYEDACLTAKMKSGADKMYEGDEPPKWPNSILIKSKLLYTARTINVFGDHRGVRALLDLQNEPASVRRDSSFELSKFEDATLLRALEMRDGIPTRTECESRARAFDLLQSVLLESLPQGVNLRILPVGSYGLGVWTASSDLDCLCIGSYTRSTFITTATEKLCLAADRGINSPRQVETRAGTALELEVRLSDNVPPIKMDLTYARSELPLPAESALGSMPAETLWALKAYRELDYVQRSVPDIAPFRLAHRFIKIWAEGRGIYSGKFGYLSGSQITILLTRVQKRLARSLAAFSLSELLEAFFEDYASFDWEKNMASDEFFHDDLQYHRTKSEPLAILGYYQPTLNTSLSASVSSAWTVKREFQHQWDLLKRKVRSWADLLQPVFPVGRVLGGHLPLLTWKNWKSASRSLDLFANYRHYIKISAQYSGGSTTRGRGFVSWVESRFKSLLVDLDTKASNARFRFWPARFADRDFEDKAGENYRAIYIIGIDWMEDNVQKKEAPEATGAVSNCLENFVGQIRGDQRRYDKNSMQFFCEVADIPFKTLWADTRNWDAHMLPDEDPEDEADQVSHVQDDWYASDKKRGKKKRPSTNQPRSVIVPKMEGAGKFRTAADVLNRLRWDPTYDHDDFVVGYEDRFIGPMERGLDRWKLEQTHEEFIPQHRILYFKRKSDEVVVWERRTRTDLVFGSG